MFMVAGQAQTNQPPVAVSDSYTAHGAVTTIGPMLANDYDPDGDQLNFELLTFPQHGEIYGIYPADMMAYRQNFGYVGTDTFTYRVRDGRNAYSSAVTVTINVVNNPPVAVADYYTAYGYTFISPFTNNDYEPDGDGIELRVITGATHGVLYGVQGGYMYQPWGYIGTDTATYKICDYLGACSPPATVTILSLGDWDGRPSPPHDGGCPLDRCGEDGEFSPEGGGAAARYGLQC